MQTIQQLATWSFFCVRGSMAHMRIKLPVSFYDIQTDQVEQDLEVEKVTDCMVPSDADLCDWFGATYNELQIWKNEQLAKAKTAYDIYKR